MTDIVEHEATPRAELERQIMDPNIPKNEREWWAADEIERLGALAAIVREQGFEIERLQGHMRSLADTSVARDTAGIFQGLWQGSEKECEQLQAEIERLRALALAFLDCQTDEHAEALRRALEPKP